MIAPNNGINNGTNGKVNDFNRGAIDNKGNGNKVGSKNSFLEI